MPGPPDPLLAANLAYGEEMREAWLEDPSSVGEEWQALFEAEGGAADPGRAVAAGPSFTPAGIFAHASSSPAPAPPGNRSPAPAPVAASPATPAGPSPAPVASADAAAFQERVSRLVAMYRGRGHKVAAVDPLGMPRTEEIFELELDHHGLTDADLRRPVAPQTLSGAPGGTPLSEVISRLKTTYCRGIGVQYMHIDDSTVRSWLMDQMEPVQNRLILSRDEQIRILTKLTDAEIFEQFIHKKFPGMKRFSLEGGESLIPLMDLCVEAAGAQGIDEIVIGMAHRGRLNVLANIMEKEPRQIFREFQDADPEQYTGRGDVKYHMGYSGDRPTATGRRVHLSLTFNPSHLECVGPVVIGRVRAKQDRQGDTERARVMGLVVHGDSAFAGQGVNQELLNMSELPGYTTGGTIHIILNNQIGFTTPPEESRSTRYCTDVARMLQIPVFHVNGEDPEAVAQVIRLAMSFRQEFKKDVVIDMWCYRRYGHNEGDEPMFTQPLMYKAIKARKSVREAYMERLLGMGKVSAEEAEEIAEERRTSSSAIAIPDDEADEPADDPAALRGGFASSLTKTGAFRIVTRTQDRLEEELLRSKELEFHYEQDAGLGIWRGYNGGADADTPRVETRLPAEELVDLATRLATLPEGFNAHPKITKMLTARLEMAQGARPMDWGAAEALGFASLVAKGTRIRITGQDAERGTFSHRHSVLHDQEDAHRHTPLREVEAAPGIFEVRNSPLSETGVLGFEYGYSLDTPDGLVVWEAQFGDFANVAQVIIDQFISSCEDKWCRLSALVMLLPHGFEGQGPEHSSARLERYLALSAEDNMQVVNLTTPAQWFHCLRRQVVRPYRKPLIVMSPKSLLRHPRAVSTVEDLSEGRFHRILADEGERDAKAVTKVLLCSGKLYYELEQHRREEGREDVAVLRLEQIYPLATADLLEALSAYREGTPVTWVQEEPFNMGAWYHLSARLGSNLGGRHPFACASRPESASPATGSAASHKLEQARLIKEAFADGD